MHSFILRHKHALGDTICVTALVRDIHRAYPGEYRVMVDTGWATVWSNNHGALPADYTIKPAPIVIELDYRKGIRASQDGRRIHFLAWYHQDFADRTGLPVPLTEPKGELHMLPHELRRTVDGPYWVVVAGGKLDLTTKLWKFRWYQEVVNQLRNRGLRFVQAGATHTGHIHPQLQGVLNTVGATGERELFNLIANADGVVCGVTAAMHIAAVFDKPCVVVAGGREEPWWEQYSGEWNAFADCQVPVKVPHRYLHTLGKLHCCLSRGCWLKRTVPIEVSDETSGRGKLCKEPYRDTDQAVPMCMSMISPQQVIDAVWSYYQDGTLHPPCGPVAELGFSGQLVAPASKALLRLPAERPSPPVVNDPLLDHPIIGGKFTIFVLCYGDHAALARRCLDGIFKTCPADRILVRVAANQCCAETINYLRDLPLQRLYIHADNRLKYPAMREMFTDRDCPIDSNYLIWFDDDSYVVDSKWLSRLASSIILNHPGGCRLYGWKFLHDLTVFARRGHRPDLWFKSAPWYKNKDLRVSGQQVHAPNGSCIDFVAGGFWALGTDALWAGNIPDDRLRLNGGDIVIGAQVEQAGFKVKDFNTHKVYVHSSGADPRGLSESGMKKRYPWDGKG